MYTYQELIEEIADLRKEIQNFHSTHGSYAGCSMRTLTFESMQNRLAMLQEMLSNGEYE